MISTEALLIIMYALLGAVICLCFFSAFVLFRRAEGIRSRRILGWMLLVWGSLYMAMLSSSFFNGNVLPNRGIMAVFGLTTGNFIIIIPLFYIIEVVRSGWLTLRRQLLCFVPFIVLVGTYFVVLALRNEVPLVLPNRAAVITHLGEFNVWYRLIMLTATQLYVVIIMLLLARYIPAYRRWAEEHHSSPEPMDVGWIKNYIAGFFVLGVIYVTAMLTGSWYVHVVHYIYVLLFFGYVAYKGMFHHNAYPEGFFRHTLNETKADLESQTDDDDLTPTETGDAFSGRLEEYKVRFDEWMRCERPYLRTDFKRADVGELFPINRTYLSRLFSEGYNTSFSQVVRHYRVEEAKRLIREHPRLTAKQLYPLCGFASHAVFHRSFTEATGMTVKEYRETCQETSDEIRSA